MTYSDVKRLINSRKLPISTVNEKGEKTIISEGKIGDLHYYETQTFLSNGWERLTAYYANGTVDESYDRNDNAGVRFI